MELTITWHPGRGIFDRGAVDDDHPRCCSLVFFAATALIHYALPRVVRPYFLLVVSYGFFCYDPVNRPLVWVLVAATLVTWLCGLIIGRVKVKAVRVLALSGRHRRRGRRVGLLQILEPAGRHAAAACWRGAKTCWPRWA